MKVLLPALLVLVLTLSGFIAGYWFCSTHPTENGLIEDYALINVLNELAYLGYFNSNKKDDLRKIIDVNLDMHIKYIRNYDGELTDEEFVNSKVRILNDVALLWDKYPPFQSDEFKPNEINSSWINEWKSEHQKNLELLQWAKGQCSTRADINCKNQSKSNKNLNH